MYKKKKGPAVAFLIKTDSVEGRSKRGEIRNVAGPRLWVNYKVPQCGGHCK
jgi:hypothetical protein